MIVTNHDGRRPDRFYEIDSFLINDGHNEDITGAMRYAVWEATDDTEMDDGTVLLSASRHQDPSTWIIRDTNFKQGTETTFRRFFTGPVNEGHRRQQYNGIIQSLLVYQPSRNRNQVQLIKIYLRQPLFHRFLLPPYCIMSMVVTMRSLTSRRDHVPLHHHSKPSSATQVAHSRETRAGPLRAPTPTLSWSQVLPLLYYPHYYYYC